MSEIEKATIVTDNHRATAQLAIRAFWLRHVLRIAEKSWWTGSDFTVYPPTREEVEEAAKVLAEMEPKSDLCVAS